jgi:cation diffusion facilitator family transporter
MPFSKWMASKVAPGFDDPANPDARARVGLLEGWVSVVTNSVLTVFKGWLGFLTGSVALLADAAHTFADSLTSVVVIVGFRMTRKPADREHPFGHGRVESVAGVVVAVLLGVTAFEMGRAGVERILEPQPVRAEWWVIAAVAATLLVKLWLGLFSRDLGRLIGSPALIADAWHHMSDVFATALVIVAFMGPRWGLVWIDGAMGVGVALMIAWAAIESMRGATGPLLGEPAPDDMYREIARRAREHDGVLGVHDILVHRYGGVSIVSLHVEVPHDESAMRLHELSQRIEEEIAKRFPGHAVVHVDPVNRGHPQYERVRGIVEEVIGGTAECASFHDLRLVGGRDRFKVVFDFTARQGLDEKAVQECRGDVVSRLADRLPGVEVVVTAEPPYLRDAPAEVESTDEE